LGKFAPRPIPAQKACPALAGQCKPLKTAIPTLGSVYSEILTKAKIGKICLLTKTDYGRKTSFERKPINEKT
jgi:hypothetical protein